MCIEKSNDEDGRLQESHREPLFAERRYRIVFITHHFRAESPKPCVGTLRNVALRQGICWNPMSGVYLRNLSGTADTELFVSSKLNSCLGRFLFAPKHNQ